MARNDNFMKISKYYWFVIASGAISGLIVFGGQVLAGLGFSLYQISTLPYLAGIIILTGYILVKKIFPEKKLIPMLILYGFIETGIILCQFAAPILGASIAITVLLLYIQPLWTTIITALLLKEKINRNNIIACGLVVAGVLFLVNPFDLQNTTLAGFIVALLGGIFLAGWVTAGSHISKGGNRPIVTMYYGNLIALVLLAVSFPVAKLFTGNLSLVGFSFDKSAIAWLAIVAFGIITYLINHYCYLKGTQKVPTVSAGIIMLVEPIVGAILAAVFLHQSITLGIIIGGSLILSANYLVIKGGNNAYTD